jgi:hypothetical protein
MAALLAVFAAHAWESAVHGQQLRVPGEEYISEGIPKMPNPPGPAPKRDLSGVWVGPGTSNKPDPAPPMTAAGEAIFKQRKAYNLATNLGSNANADPGASNDPAIKCDPLGFPRNVQTYAITNRGGLIFGSAPNRILIAYEQNRLWREIWMDGRALPKAVDVKGAPSRDTTVIPSATGKTTPRSSSTRRVWTSARGSTRWDIRAARWRAFRNVTRASINTTSG